MSIRRFPMPLAVIVCAVFVAGRGAAGEASNDEPDDTIVLGPGDEVDGMRLTTATATDTEIFNFCDPVVLESGTFHRDCEVPAVQRLLIGWGDLASSPELLEDEWQAQTWSLFLDDRPVDLDAFGTLPDRDLIEPAAGGDVWLRQWGVSLVNLTPGEHTLRYLVETTGAGEETAGATDVTWTFTVARAQPDVETGVVGGEWEVVRPGGDCQCALGTEYAFFVRNADPTRVVFFLQGGGACFSADTCAPPSGLYDSQIDDGDNPDLASGIFDLSRPENPLRDYSMVFVPYCTGDVHIGDNTAEYSPELTVQHKGWVNGTAARGYLADNFPDAAQVVVVGASAGSIAAPLYAGVISDQLPDAQITVFADGSGAYPDAANPQVAQLWDTSAMRSAFPEYSGGWTLPRYFVAAGLHDPDIVMARFDFAFDGVQAGFMTITGADTSDLEASMDNNEALIEATGVTQHSYTAPGDNHTIVQDPQFYDLAVNDVALLDWVTALIAGEPMRDVHCEDCEPPPS